MNADTTLPAACPTSPVVSRVTNTVISQATRAFTLIELMVVISIIALLAALAIPTLDLGGSGNSMTGAADKLESELTLARQAAQADNRSIQVRFFNYSNPDAGMYDNKFRGYQFFSVDNDGETRPSGRFVALPKKLIITASPQFSTLVQSELEVSGSSEIPASSDQNTSAPYVGFNFRPSGETNLRTVDKLWFLTIVDEALDPVDSGQGLPTEFITIQVDPFNGRVTRWER